MERERHIIGYLQKESKKMVEDFQSKQEPIDFGAFDSELQGWEYTIPEGYSAEIKDGKVIVKKAENEDERIRQAILRYFNAELLASEEERDKEILKKWIACLEKQKEDKKTYFDGYLKGYNEGQLNPIEKQKEQKPIQFKNDELVEIIKGEFEGFRRLLKKKGIDYEPQRGYWEGFARLFDSSAREYVKEQNPAWSEEDEAIVKFYEDDCNSRINNMSMKEIIEMRQKFKDWVTNRIKFLRPQPKQEWSEKEEKILDSLIRLYSKEYSAYAWPWANGAFTYGDVVNFLESLRPSPHWKPSEEQMNELWSAISYIELPGSNYLGVPELLESLYEQLKKL